MTLDHAQPPEDLLDPIIDLRDPEVRISSMRRRQDSIVVTLYNSANESVETVVDLAEHVKKVSLVKIGGTRSSEVPILGRTLTLSFNPREIKMCNLQI
ncbi:hypothetical protein EU545_03590 [Candidatus Thorarchaeota archaeon]|nr:MAG: hypothetical protein EU545_03590 [Candidatus Thorarchaeota archaeon]